MICTDAEYRHALQRLAQEDETLRAQREHLVDLDLSDEEAERAMQPLLSFRAQLAEEVEAYTQMKRGDLGPLQSLTAIGRALAERLGVHESQVLRDERNDYRGVTAERAQRILEALGVRFVAQAESLLDSDPSTEYA